MRLVNYKQCRRKRSSLGVLNNSKLVIKALKWMLIYLKKLRRCMKKKLQFETVQFCSIVLKNLHSKVNMEV